MGGRKRFGSFRFGSSMQAKSLLFFSLVFYWNHGLQLPSPKAPCSIPLAVSQAACSCTAFSWQTKVLSIFAELHITPTRLIHDDVRTPIGVHAHCNDRRRERDLTNFTLFHSGHDQPLRTLLASRFWSLENTVVILSFLAFWYCHQVALYNSIENRHKAEINRAEIPRAYTVSLQLLIVERLH